MSTRFEAWEARLKSLRSILASAVALAALMLVVVLAVLVVRHERVFTPVVMLDLSIDKAQEQDKVDGLRRSILSEFSRLQLIGRQALRADGRGVALIDDQTTPDVVIPRTGVSLRIAMTYLRTIMSPSSERVRMHVEAEEKQQCVSFVPSDLERECAPSNKMNEFVQEAAGLLLRRYDPCAFSMLPLVESNFVAKEKEGAALAEGSALECLVNARTGSEKETAVRLWAKVVREKRGVPEALEWVEHARRSRASSEELLLEWGSMLDSIGEKTVATEKFQQVVDSLDATPNQRARALAGLGRLAQASGAFPLAQTHLEAAIRASNDPIQVAFAELDIGRLLWIRADCECLPHLLVDAQRHLTDATVHYSRLAEAYQLLGRIHQSRAELAADEVPACAAEVQGPIRGTLAALPGIGRWLKPNVHVNGGSDWKPDEELEKAGHYFRVANLLDGSYWEAENSLGVIAASKRNFDTAAMHHNNAAYRNPRSPIPHVDWAKMLLKRGDINGARDQIQEARKLNEWDGEFVYEVSAMLAETENRWVVAVDNYREAAAHVDEQCHSLNRRRWTHKADELATKIR